MNEYCQTLFTEGQYSGIKQNQRSQISGSLKKYTDSDEVDTVNENLSKLKLNPQNSMIQPFESISYKSIMKQQDEGFVDSIANQLKDVILKIRFKKYAKVLLDLTRSRMLRLLTVPQIKLINDKSYWREDEIKVRADNQNRLKRIKTLNRYQSYIHQTESQSIKTPSFFSKIFKCIPVFLPNSKFVELWQAIKIISVLICFFCYLICFAFEAVIQDFFRFDMIFTCQIILLLDVFMNLNTGIYVKGQLCTDRQKILLHYKYTKAFYYDVSTQFFTLSYFIFLNDLQRTRIALSLLLPIIFKYNDINIVIKKMKDRFLLDRKIQNIIELINLLKNILLISHVFACIWVLAAKISPEISLDDDSIQKNCDTNSYYNSSSWIELMRIGGSSWIIQYIYSYYFITVTMITVGYGDVKPTNTIEVIVCTFLMMICCVIFGFTINSIGEIFQDFYLQEKKIQYKRYIIGNYMMRKGVGRSTMKAVYEYLEYYWKEQSDENVQFEQDIISQLSNGLREELLAESNRIIFKQSCIFRDNFSQDFLLKCLPIIHEQRCTPDEVIYDHQLGDSDIWIYFIQKGEVEVYIESCYQIPGRKISSQRQTIQKLKEGESFGEISFFSGDQLRMSLRSLNFSKLLKMKRSDFIRVLNEDKLEYEMFCMIKDKIKYSNDFTSLQKKCLSCDDRSHEEGTCPRLHLSLNKGKIIGKLLHSIPHTERKQSKQRHIQFKQSTFENLENNNNRLMEYMNQRYEDLIEYEENNLFSTPFSRQNSHFVPQMDIDNFNSPFQENPISNFNNCSNNQQIIEQSPQQQIINSPNSMSIIATLSTIATNNLNQNQLQKTENINGISKQSQFQKKKQISFKKQQSLLKYNKQTSNQSYNQDSDHDYENDEIKQETSFYGKQKNNLEKSLNLDKIFERETSISNQFRKSFTNLSAGASSDVHLGSNGQGSQDRLLNLKQQQMTRSNAKELNSTKSTQFQQDISSNIQYEKSQQITSQRLLPISVPVNQQVIIQDPITKRAYFSQFDQTKSEQCENFDLFQGMFEKIQTFINYFPRYNYKNVLSRIIQRYNISLPSKRGSLKIDFTRNLLTQNQIKLRKSVINSQNSILTKNYQEQRKQQKSKTSAFKAENELLSQQGKITSLYLIGQGRQESIIPSKYSTFQKKQEQFDDDDDSNIIDRDLSSLKMDPETPPHSEDFSNFKDIQSTYIKKSTYDFQCKEMSRLKKNFQ